MVWVLLYFLPTGELPPPPLAVFGTESACLVRASTIKNFRAPRFVDALKTDLQLSEDRLQRAVFNLRFQGEMADELAMLQRFGVAYLTPQGNLRPMQELVDDAANAIAKQPGLDPGQRYQMARSFGFVGRSAQIIALGPDAVTQARASVGHALCVAATSQN